MECNKKRERKANFAENEVMALLQNIAEQRHIIQSKLQSAITLRQKKEAWRRVTDAVNSIGIAARDEEEVRKKWKDVKSSVLKEQASSKKTGGGPPTKSEPVHSLVMAILGDRSDVVRGIDGGKFCNYFHLYHS